MLIAFGQLFQSYFYNFNEEKKQNNQEQRNTSNRRSVHVLLGPAITKLEELEEVNHSIIKDSKEEILALQARVSKCRLQLTFSPREQVETNKMQLDIEAFESMLVQLDQEIANRMNSKAIIEKKLTRLREIIKIDESNLYAVVLHKNIEKTNLLHLKEHLDKELITAGADEKIILEELVQSIQGCYLCLCEGRAFNDIILPFKQEELSILTPEICQLLNINDLPTAFRLYPNNDNKIISLPTKNNSSGTDTKEKSNGSRQILPQFAASSDEHLKVKNPISKSTLSQHNKKGKIKMVDVGANAENNAARDDRYLITRNGRYLRKG